MIKRLLPFLMIALLAAGPASAAAKTPAGKQSAQEKPIGSYGGWNAFTYRQGGQTVCYMVTTHIVKSLGPKRATPYLMITHRPVEGSTDVFSYGAGTDMNAKKGAQILAGKAAFELFTVRDIGWARDALTDHKIAAAIRANARLSAKAVPAAKGAKPIVDTFDLTGAPLAYRAIGRACGLPDPDKPAKQARPAAKKKAAAAQSR